MVKPTFITETATPPPGEDRLGAQQSRSPIVRWLTDRQTHIRLALWGLAAVVAFTLAYIGYVEYYAEMSPQEGPAFLTDYVYHSLMLFVPGSAPDRSGLPVPLDVARFFAPIVGGFAAFAGLTVLFRDRIQQLLVMFMSEHVVVCGLGYVGSMFVDDLRSRATTTHDRRQTLRDLARGRWGWRRIKKLCTKVKVVVIEKDANNPLVEMWRKQGVPVIIGDAQQHRTLRAAGVRRALHLLAVCDEDAVNSQIIAEAQALVAGRRGVLHCLARIGDTALCSLLRWQQLNRADDGSSTLDFFNLDETAASLWLEEFPIVPAGRQCHHPHLLVSRLDGLGTWLVRHAARNWYDVRGREVDAQTIPLVITVVDDRAEERVEDLVARHPELADVCKFVCLTSRDTDLSRMSKVHQEHNAPPLSRAYVAAYRDEEALQTALALRQALDNIDPRIPLVVAMSRNHGVARLIIDRVDGSNMEVFPALDRLCVTEFVLGGSFEPIAIALHEHWRRMKPTARGAAEPPTWRELDESRRQSNRAQARDIKVKLLKLGYRITPAIDWKPADFTFHEDRNNPHNDEIEILARQEHDRWWREREADGWKWCPLPETSEQKPDKLSPYLIPFEELPLHIANYDREFVRAIPGILASAGFRIERPGDRTALR